MSKLRKGECYTNEYGFVIDADGNVIAEPGTDADFDTYAVEVQNGLGYYDSEGKFRRYHFDGEY